MKIPLETQMAWRRLRVRLHLWRWHTMTRFWRWSKRSIDLLVVVPLGLLLAPMLGVLALWIWAIDRGPVLYWQRRVGLNGVEFDFPKFRSMCVNSDAIRAQLMALNQHGEQGVTFKMKRDPRVTAAGRFMRRFSIDELPQLWCVLTGEMTLVGPRPPLPSEVALYTQNDRERLRVTPGLTCIWQVSGRSEIPFDKQVLMDIDYIQQASLKTDVLLLLKTIPAVLLGRGAY
jgi:lipopolysaccharide/colanic/teichoic acid biosynthesis glycosyltransferase